jgi:hypothetical protein
VAAEKGDGAAAAVGDGAETAAGVAVVRGTTGARADEGGRTEVVDDAGIAMGVSSIPGSES